MKKSKTLLVSSVTALVISGLAGCGGSTEETETAAKAEKVEIAEPAAQTETVQIETSSTDGPILVSGEFDEKPDAYPWIAAEDFQTAFDAFHTRASEMDATGMTYDEIEAIFGVPGAYYVDKDYNDGEYKYYKWFSDDGKDVLITFKGDSMTYFAWTSGTVQPSNS